MQEICGYARRHDAVISARDDGSLSAADDVRELELGMVMPVELEPWVVANEMDQRRPGRRGEFLKRGLHGWLNCY